jgi:hypothetical protein
MVVDEAPDPILQLRDVEVDQETHLQIQQS